MKLIDDSFGYDVFVYVKMLPSKKIIVRGLRFLLNEDINAMTLISTFPLITVQYPFCHDSTGDIAAGEEGVQEEPTVTGNSTPIVVQIPKELLGRIWRHRLETMSLRMSIFRNLYDQGVVVGSGSGYGSDYVIYESK